METRKRIRLAAPAYRGRGWYFITVCTQNRTPFFRQPLLAKALIHLLVAAASHRRFLLHAWCVIPDHVHILCEGTCDRSAACVFVNRWKGASALRFERELGRDIWQRAFYDHVLRPWEPVHSFLCYIWMNPVRKGLCRSPYEYPWSGSLTIDWKKTAVRVDEQWSPPWKRVSGTDGAIRVPGSPPSPFAEEARNENT